MSPEKILQVTLPGEGNAFAFIYSVEDPGGGGENGGVGAQVITFFVGHFLLYYVLPDFPSSMKGNLNALLQIMGPEDSYLLQYSNDVDSFWAEGNALELGATFAANTAPPKSRVPKVNALAIDSYKTASLDSPGLTVQPV